MKQKAVSETAQRAADAYIELAQFLEKLAAAYKDRAKHYRAGTLDVGYSNLPPEAGDHMRHPAQRAIDAMSEYDVKATYERIRAELTAATTGKCATCGAGISNAQAGLSRARADGAPAECKDCCTAKLTAEVAR